MPARPKKCCGKKVIFTPINIKKKCTLDQRWCRVTPDIRGNQWWNPANKAKIAPIERT
jgi:hypothetical protein